MKVGTIVRNMWQPSYESLLLYTGTSGKHARCIWVINGEFHGMHPFYKKDILEDREHFPIVGFFDYKKAFVDAVRNAVSPEDLGIDSLKSILKKYFSIGDSYTYELTRVKEAFEVGTMTIDDFQEWTEENISDLAKYITRKAQVIIHDEIGVNEEVADCEEKE